MLQAGLGVKFALIVLLGNERTDNVCLLSLFESSAQRTVGDITVCVGENACGHARASNGPMSDNARLKVTVDRKRKGARNRGSRHDKQVSAGPLGTQKITLPHAKAMLFVDYYERKVRKDNIIPQHSMGSKEDIELTAAKGG